jgi:hypothetical protein
MKRFIAVIALALSLGACAQLTNAYNVVTGATITPNQVYIAANAFDAVEASATTYLRLPACGSAPCRNVGATNTIVAAVRAGRLARNALEAAVNTNPGAPVNANLMATLTSSTSTLKAILSEFGAS